MTSALALPRGLRHPAWYAPLLLPILPLLAGLGQADTFGYPGESVLRASLLLVLGMVCALFVPSVLDRLGWTVRKEAEQLRPAWLVSLFVAQACAFAVDSRFTGPPELIFGMTTALVASFAFGAEFQQRTLPALLAQPIGRRHIWSTKMGVLGAALASSLAVFLISGPQAASGPLPGDAPEVALGTVAFVLLAWATTPAWTLFTRGILAGLVFSFAAPIVLLALFTAFADQAPETGILLVLGTVYGIAVHLAGRRAWLRLEAPDAPAGEATGTIVIPWARLRSRAARFKTRNPVGRLFAKELHLQSVTWITAALAIGLATFSAMLEGSRPDTAAFLRGAGGLLAAMTLLLGAAIAVAEERRLGTLDLQVLVPIPPHRLWWIKVAAAGLPALPALTVAFLAISSPPYEWDIALQIVGIALPAFIVGIYASTLAANALRALLLGMVLSGMTWFLSVAFVGLIIPQTAHHTALAVHQSLEADSAYWLDLASRAAPDAPTRSESLVRLTETQALGALVAIPLALALGVLELARRNFARPVHAPTRAGRQLAGLAAVLVLTGLGMTLITGVVVRHVARQENLDEAIRHRQLDARLSPAERDLRQTILRVSVSGLPGVMVRTRTFRAGADVTAPQEPYWAQVHYALPLTPSDRTRLVEHGDLPDELRDALRREANPDVPPDTLPKGKPPGPWPSDRATTYPGFSPRRFGWMGQRAR